MLKVASVAILPVADPPESLVLSQDNAPPLPSIAQVLVNKNTRQALKAGVKFNYSAGFTNAFSCGSSIHELLTRAGGTLAPEQCGGLYLSVSQKSK